MIDLAQVSLALRNCTVRSLVLLDEFGKGTLSTGSFYLCFIFDLIIFSLLRVNLTFGRPSFADRRAASFLT